MRLAALFFLLFPGFAQALEPTDPQWLALLHFSGSRSSAAPGAPFFLSPQGHENPAAELAATVQYFDEHPDEAPCRFPARAIVLGRLKEGQGGLCRRWRIWRDALSARGIELVFAAAFLNSPSSMYGHTLLKFPRSGKTEGAELLDYTLSYGAETGQAAGLAYVVAGLTGGFSGKYATAPFYLKVKEYNFVENRDFWIYPLLVTETELRILAAHAWELREVAFPYFFLHRNCSFYLLEFLEVARPGGRLTASFPFWTVPVDTIRRLESGGWVGTPRYRPSRYRRLRELKARLSAAEARTVADLARGAAPPLPGGREAVVLDAAYELWRYGNESRAGADPRVEQALLQARSRWEAPPWQPDGTRERPPEEGHPSSRLSFGPGFGSEGRFLELGYRAALHDLLADPHGFEEGSELSMGDFRFRAAKGKFFLDRLDLLRLRSLSPRESWFSKTAWHFRAFAERAKEFSCAGWGCLGGGVEGGAGVAARLGASVVFALAEAGMEAGGVFDRGYRFSAGPAAGIFSPLWGGGRLLAEGEWRFRLLGSERARRRARAGLAQSLGRSWEVRGLAELGRGYREGALQALWYF